MKLFEKIMYPLLACLLAFAVFEARTNQVYFDSHLSSEGGFFQWMIFSTLMFASLMCYYRASILRPFRGGLFSACLVIAGFIFMAFALDEISWGQHVFGFESPEFFKVRNALGQTNIHKLVIAGFQVNEIVFTLAIKIIASLYFLVLPFFYTRLDQIKLIVNRYAIPLPRFTHIGAYATVAIVVSFIPSNFRHIVFEFCFYWILVLMMYNPLNDDVFSRKSLVR